MFGMHCKFSPLARPSPCQDTRSDALAGQSSRRRLQPIWGWLFIQEETGQQWWRAGTSCPSLEQKILPEKSHFSPLPNAQPLSHQRWALPAFGVRGNGGGWNKWKRQKNKSGIKKEKKSAVELFNMLKALLGAVANEPHLLPNSHPQFPNYSKDKVSQSPHKDSAAARHTLLLCVFAPAQVNQAHRFIPFTPFHFFHFLRQAHRFILFIPFHFFHFSIFSISSTYPIPFLQCIMAGSQIYSIYPIPFI